MLAAQLINTGFPAVNLFDKVSLALQLMDEYDVFHLPVLSAEKYAGIISKDDLLDADENNLLASLEAELLPVSVKGEEYFLAALKLIADHELSLLPVVNEQTELTGVIPARELMRTLSVYLGNDTRGGIIVLEISKRNFSFGEISRLVETNDAYITQLNTFTEPETGIMIVTLKINRIEISDIVATFQRYEYLVKYYFGEESYANELKANYDHLISYLNM
ncbi:MAG: CBS domain-containing protein [Bacteroidota bacterium]|nr:CBS domain-containing protein [Bacteroidota bacterium]